MSAEDGVGAVARELREYAEATEQAMPELNLRSDFVAFLPDRLRDLAERLSGGVSSGVPEPSVLDVACPACTSPPGEGCVSESGSKPPCEERLAKWRSGVPEGETVTLWRANADMPWRSIESGARPELGETGVFVRAGSGVLLPGEPEGVVGLLCPTCGLPDRSFAAKCIACGANRAGPVPEVADRMREPAEPDPEVLKRIEETLGQVPPPRSEYIAIWCSVGEAGHLLEALREGPAEDGEPPMYAIQLVSDALEDEPRVSLEQLTRLRDLAGSGVPTTGKDQKDNGG